MDSYLYNPCLRPASLCDLPQAYAARNFYVLRQLYEAEWKLRGYRRSP